MMRLMVLMLVMVVNLIGPVVDVFAEKRPNILFAISDDQSFPHASAYGTKWVKTPGFDRVAKEGLLFTRCYTPNAKCAPSRSIIITGRNTWQLEEAGNHWPVFPMKFKSFAEALNESGYHVGYTGKGWGPGIAKHANGKRRELLVKGYQKFTKKPPARAISGRDYARNFDAFLKDNEGDKPWFFWYGCTEPHRAYQYKVGVEKGGKRLSDIDKVPGFWPDTEKVRHDMLDYAYEIEHFDDHLVKMLKTLEAQGELENTIVVVTSDNGMPFPRVKGNAFEYSNHLPLAIMWPRGIKKPGRVVDDYVNFIDFAPTFIEVAGLAWDKTGMARTNGRSLTDVFNSEKSGKVNPERDHVLIGKERHDMGRPNDWGYPIRGIVKDGFLYLRNYENSRWPSGNPETGYLNTDGSPTKSLILEMRRSGKDQRYWQINFGKYPEEQLFQLDNDPECLKNLAKEKGYQTIKDEMKKLMIEKLKGENDPRMAGKGEVFDQYEYSDKRTRGFYERFMRGELKRGAAGWVNPGDFESKKLD